MPTSPPTHLPQRRHGHGHRHRLCRRDHRRPHRPPALISPSQTPETLLPSPIPIPQNRHVAFPMPHSIVPIPFPSSPTRASPPHQKKKAAPETERPSMPCHVTKNSLKIAPV
ncbi:hypothetical protein CC80DRAFT_39524 [Byssothecium circinans]|uniref:Uncharacterized protein n=1 Tax=Byssothecium circinans TaxID=147558 RepID=A0A6A5U2J1_9PLEO|nr:hypothetical protein CC80DRAFT_39524 [Byssothecium circinans]